MFATKPQTTSARPIAHVEDNNIDFQTITDRREFDALEHEWNALFDRAGRGTHVFQTFNWNWHWANTYLPADQKHKSAMALSIVTARRDGNLIMIWPLVSERAHGIKQILWMGDPVSQYGDVLLDRIDDGLNVMRQAWAYIQKTSRCDVVRLRHVRADANIAPLLAELQAITTDRQVAPYLDLSSASTFEKYETRFTSKSRGNRRRLLRRLSDGKTIAFERHHAGHRAGELVRQAIDLKTAWLRDRGLVSTALSDARMAQFMAAAVADKNKSVDCVVAALTVDGEPAAIEISFTCKGHLAQHVIVFDLRFEKAGVGILLMEQSLRDDYSEAIATHDLLAPTATYKMDWADATMDVNDWAVPMNLAGQVYAHVYLAHVRPRAKAAVQAMPTKLRKVMASGLGSIAVLM
ncbi:MAG: cellulose biosynthesis protein CelD [Hyphomicrobium sp.]|nr:MAG: cellulose biosynthesis protein CelD [Hyphomicrobium sp.]PPD01891.1 MAG: cellulose biosynthesis protein CelD [Hyphomicrobium sp.]